MALSASNRGPMAKKRTAFLPGIGCWMRNRR
jgi:hypothetical protein